MSNLMHIVMKQIISCTVVFCSNAYETLSRFGLAVVDILTQAQRFEIFVCDVKKCRVSDNNNALKILQLENLRFENSHSEIRVFKNSRFLNQRSEKYSDQKITNALRNFVLEWCASCKTKIRFFEIKSSCNYYRLSVI